MDTILATTRNITGQNFFQVRRRGSRRSRRFFFRRSRFRFCFDRRRFRRFDHDRLRRSRLRLFRRCRFGRRFRFFRRRFFRRLRGFILRRIVVIRANLGRTSAEQTKDLGFRLLQQLELYFVRFFAQLAARFNQRQLRRCAGSNGFSHLGSFLSHARMIFVPRDYFFFFLLDAFPARVAFPVLITRSFGLILITFLASMSS